MKGAVGPCPLDQPCEVEGGDYALALPSGWDGESPLPALMFFHGYAASAAAPMASQRLREELDARGVLLIAPNGSPSVVRDRRSWGHQGSPSRDRDEPAFVHAVLEDVARRVPLNRGEIYVGGFSQGSSMAWHVACFDPEPYAGFVTISGAFWEPLPATCPAPPRRMIHFHGLADQVVPLEGRPIGEGYHQGDVFESLDLLRDAWSCPSMPEEITIDAEREWRAREWVGCAPDAGLLFVLHDGGHAGPPGWEATALDWLGVGTPEG